MNATNTVTSSWWLVVFTLWKREVVRFLRQRSRVIGAMATPIVFWVLIGSGLGRSFRLGGGGESVDYLEYFFPGTLVMIVLFTAIFSTISIIEDRGEGFLQGVLVAPVSRQSIVVGKVMGSTTLALIQALIFLMLAPVAGVSLTASAFAMSTGILMMLGLGLSALGFLIAWPMESTQGFHAIMNLFLFPMWFLSGALFPASGASGWVSWIMALNPLTYGVAALRHAMYPPSSELVKQLPPMLVCLAVTAGFAMVMIALCTRAVQRRA